MSTPSEGHATPNMTLVVQFMDGSSACHHAPMDKHSSARLVLKDLAHKAVDKSQYDEIACVVAMDPNVTIAYNREKFLWLIDEAGRNLNGVSVNISALMDHELRRNTTH